HAFLQEMDGTIREHGVGPAGVEAVHFPIVGAVNRARSRRTDSLAIGAPKNEPAVKGFPGAADDIRLCGNPPAGAPELRPARVFGEADGVAKAVRDLAYARHRVRYQHAPIDPEIGDVELTGVEI